MKNEYYQRTLMLKEAVLKREDLIRDIKKLDYLHYLPLHDEKLRDKIDYRAYDREVIIDHSRINRHLNKRRIGFGDSRIHYKTIKARLPGFDNANWDLVLYYEQPKVGEILLNNIEKDSDRIDSDTLDDMLNQFGGMEYNFERAKKSQLENLPLIINPSHVAAVVLTSNGFAILQEDFTKGGKLYHHEYRNFWSVMEVVDGSQKTLYQYDYCNSSYSLGNPSKFLKEEARIDIR